MMRLMAKEGRTSLSLLAAAMGERRTLLDRSQTAALSIWPVTLCFFARWKSSHITDYFNMVSDSSNLNGCHWNLHPSGSIMN